MFLFCLCSGEHQIIITCQLGEIRVWNLTTGREMRRYVLPNISCDALAISRDGVDIISGGSGKRYSFGYVKS